MESVISRRPWAIIAVWLVIVILSGPLAAGINNVVKTSEKEFLPSTVESIRASDAMENLSSGAPSASEKGGVLPFLAVVSNVPVTLNDYWKLKPWYEGLKKKYESATFSSWIDIVSAVEANVSSGVEVGLNQSLQAVKGLVEVAKAYNETLDGVNQTAQLVGAVDEAYHGYWVAGSQLQAGVPVVEETASALNTSCNVFLPAVATSYYDVVRAEALLEALTDAYTSPPIDQQDIAAVVAASNVSGAWPLDPALVVATYNATVSAGGPAVFNNSLASMIASRIALQALQAKGVPGEALAFFNLTANVWSSTVDGGDDRQIIAGSQNLSTGQLQLLQKIASEEEAVKPVLARSVGEALASQLPPEAAPLVNATVDAVLESNCTVNDQVAVRVLAGVLEEKGIPAGIAEIIASEVYHGNYTMDEALRLAVETVNTTLSQKGVVVPGELLEAIASLVERYDRNAAGALTGPSKYGVAAVLVAEQSNATLTPDVEQELLSSKSLDEATLKASRVVLASKAGEQAAGMLDLLASAGLLGRGENAILDAAPKLLAQAMAGGMANITQEQAEALLREAVRVYKGELSFDAAVGELVNNTMKEVFPKIVERFKGILVERDGKGFIVGFNVSGGSLDERVEKAKAIKADMKDGLKELGYNASILLGGDDYMSYEISTSARQDIERSDRLSMVFVIIILALIMESIAAVFLPFIGIGFGLVVSLALAYILGKYGIIDITTHSRTIMFTTGLGLGIDYAAYVSRRFREAAAKGLDSRMAAAEAYRKSVKPVMAGAVTAMIGFGSMLLAWDFPFVSSIGTNVPLTIFFVMTASITFIPALLAYVGETRWFWWPRHPVESARKTPRFMGVGRAVAGKPAIPLAIAVILAVFAGYVMAGFTGSYDLSINLPSGSEARKALEYINTNYDAGILYPVYIVASSKDKASEIANAVENLSCVSQASVMEGYQGRVVKAVMNVYPLSKEGVDCASRIRSVAHKIDPESLVGGMSAVNLDMRNLINDRFYHRVYPAAVTLMFLTFLVAYGGVITALSAIVAVVLAAYAGSALTIILFQNLMGEEVAWYLPVIVFTAILGVGMDYNSFYIARAREECSVECSRSGVAKSIAYATPTVLGLATIMAGAYVGLALASSPGLSTMGTALILGVLLAGLDASLILTPPLIALLGKASWWPRYPGKVEASGQR